ncbi:MAG: DUF3368 domain-containing protein [Bacteroidetes bacterium]|nr:DUF3368 domain-containing protein [Bacteroidota bacterium]
MIIVSDTSPISSLFLINQLELLPVVFGRIIIPQTVMAELRVLETDFGHDLATLRSAPWLEILKATDINEVNRFKQFLDAGESEAIVLAKELHADYLLIDDKQGRNAADHEGLTTIGVLGVFLLAKKAGTINAVQPLMDDLRSQAKFFIREDLYEKVLRLAGE